MTDIATTTATDTPAVTTITTTTDVKPGYKTTEWYLALAATLLTFGYSSGLLTNSTALAIAGIAGTVLTALGYKVTRAIVKAAGVLLLFTAIAGGASACSYQQVKADTTAVAKGAAVCAKADVPAVLALGMQLATEALAAKLQGNPIPWAQLKAEAYAAARTQGIEVGSCAFGQLIADLAKLLPVPAGPGVARADDGRGELADLKAALGVTEVRLANGEVL